MSQARFPKTAMEAVQRVLTHIEAQAGMRALDESYTHLIDYPELPMAQLATLGSLHRLDTVGDSEMLPSLLLEERHGQVQVELCPFGPLALLSPDGGADTDPLAQTLLDAGIWPLFPSDMDHAGQWHGSPLVQWLFPRRLSSALALFDTLHGA